MADLKYYGLSLVFHSFSFLSFFFAVCRTRHTMSTLQKSKNFERLFSTQSTEALTT